MTTNEYLRGVKQNGWAYCWGHLWQRNYYERILRNEKELYETRFYIQTNPMKWQEDEYYSIDYTPEKSL
ncbi:MAG: hypothetical protein Q7S00_05810, partial [bacterium]|nr:hypothetical protein [bacterium]